MIARFIALLIFFFVLHLHAELRVELILDDFSVTAVKKVKGLILEANLAVIYVQMLFVCCLSDCDQVRKLLAKCLLNAC